MKRKFDVVIIGAGTAGLAAREQVARRTKNYIVIDRGPLGTTCCLAGCMPSKALIEVANLVHARDQLIDHGWLNTGGRPDFPSIMRHVRKLRDFFVDHIKTEMRTWKKKHFLLGEARFSSRHSVVVGTRKLEAPHIIIATGSRPALPALFKPYEKDILTTENIFELRKLPRSLGVIGSGPIGLEIGQALARLGSKVTVFGELRSMGGLSDPRVTATARDVFGREFSLQDGQIDSVQRVGKKFQVKLNDKYILFDQLLVAVGRTPNLDQLGLERLGIPVDKSGRLELTKQLSLRGTSIMVAGDANHHRPLLHEAARQGRQIGQLKVLKDAPSLSIAFTSPQLAVVGKKFAELKKNKTKFVVGAVDFSDQGRARLKLANAGILRIYAAPKTGKLLGAEMCCPGGEHLAHLLHWSIEERKTAQDHVKLTFYHPTLEEGLRTALRQIIQQT